MKTRCIAWVVLDHAVGTLSIWKSPPATHKVSLAAEAIKDANARNNDEMCAICLEHGLSAQVSGHSIQTVCGHWFHEECLDKWRAQHVHEASCPTCRHLLGDVPLVLPPRLRDFEQGQADKGGAPKKARDVFKLVLLETMDVNPYFRTISLYFEGQHKVIVLTADHDEDFFRWEQVFRLYCDVC